MVRSQQNRINNGGANPRFASSAARWLLITICLFITGCNDDLLNAGRSLPAPVRDDFPYTIEVTQPRWWGGDNFDTNVGDVAHYIVLRGLDAPKPGQHFYLDSRQKMRELSRRQTLRVIVYSRDDQGREIGDVFIDGKEGEDEIDLGLRQISNGLAWFSGDEFDGSAAYSEAQDKAREEGLGLWSQPDPVPPSEFLEAQNKRRGL